MLFRIISIFVFNLLYYFRFLTLEVAEKSILGFISMV